MNERSSGSARLFAGLIILPLILVAALIAFQRGGDDLDAEALQLAGTLDRSLARTESSARRGLAVLPLVNETGDPELDYLTSGVAEEVRQRLTSVEGLLLIGAESSANVASQPLSLASMSRLLGVDHILHGTLDRNGERIEFDLTLYARGQDGWRAQWESEPTGVTATADAVAARVMTSLFPAGAARPGVPEAVPSGTALDNYLRGKYLIDRYNSADVLAGIGYLDRAIASDPTFERAILAKLTGHARMTWVDAPLAEEHNRLKNEAIDAWLSQERDVPLTYRLQAMQASQRNDYLAAEAAFLRALALAPRQYVYDRGRMVDLCIAGYVETCLEQALGLAQLDPVSAAAHAALAQAYLMGNDLGRAREHATLSTRFGGDMGGYQSALLTLEESEYRRGREELETALADVGVASDWVGPWLAAVRDPGKAQEAMAAMARVDDTSLGWLDLLYAELVTIGEVDRAIETAHRLIEEGYETWNLHMWTPDMKPFRNHPGFMPLMEKAGLADLWRATGPPDLCRGPAPEPFCSRINAN